MSYDSRDYDLILFLSAGSPCSLATTPENDNWVDDKGGLPNYICRIARAVKRSGRSTSQSIAIAVSRVKKWAAGGGDVTAKTRAKAAKALAQWEAMKLARDRDELVLLTRQKDGEQFIVLSRISNFNTSVVYEAWEQVETDKMNNYLDLNPHLKYDGKSHGRDSYIVELWTSYIIVSMYFRFEGDRYLKIPYTVEGSTVYFGEPTEVEKAFVPVKHDDDALDADALEDLRDALESVTMRYSQETKDVGLPVAINSGGIWPSSVTPDSDGVWDGGSP